MWRGTLRSVQLGLTESRNQVDAKEHFLGDDAGLLIVRPSVDQELLGKCGQGWNNAGPAATTKMNAEKRLMMSPSFERSKEPWAATGYPPRRAYPAGIETADQGPRMLRWSGLSRRSERG